MMHGQKNIKLKHKITLA